MNNNNNNGSESLTQKIQFPQVDWEELKKGSLPKGRVGAEVAKMIKFLIEVAMLKLSSFLSRDTLDKANEVSEKLDELKHDYPALIGVTQNILGQQIKEMAEANGDSRALFSRLQILTDEAVFQGSFQEWGEQELEKVPMGLKKNFLVKLYNPKAQTFRQFLPRNWNNETHKKTALILKDLSFKARETYRAERGLPPLSKPAEKPETPA